MDRVDHQKLLSTPSSTMPYADAVQRFKNPIESRITCPLFATYAWKWYEWPYFRFIYSWGIKGFNKSLFYGVKLPSLRAMWAKNGLSLPLEKLIHFFLGPWPLVYQSIEISNQMESNGVVSNFETKILCNSVLHNFFYPKFDTSPFDSI